MKRKTVVKSITAVVLALAMVVSTLFSAPITSLAAIGDKKDVGTGLQTGTNIDTEDTISLPIKIYDYNNDGMLFEYAMEVKNPIEDAEDYTRTTYISNEEIYWAAESSDDFWVSLKNAGAYNQYLRLDWSVGGRKPTGTVNRSEDLVKQFSTAVTVDEIRYAVIVMRMPCDSYVDEYNSSGVYDDRAGLIGFSATESESSGFSGWTKIPASAVGSDDWSYVICDLKKSSGTLDTYTSTITNLYMHSPLRSYGEYMDIATIAFFPTQAEAAAYGEYGLSLLSYNGSNTAYSLLYGNWNEDKETVYTPVDKISSEDTIYQINTYVSKVDTELEDYDFGYKLYGTFLGTEEDDRGVATLGLLESALVDGKPRYKEDTVTYLAGLMEETLTVEEYASNNVRNYSFVKGEPSAIFGTDANGDLIDLATALRNRITEGSGTYAQTIAKIKSGKKLIGTWAECQGNISTYHDAAYFLLNSIYTAGSYNDPQDNYDYLVLSKGTLEDGKEAYIFDAGFTDSATASSASSATAYDETKGTISNSDASGKSYVQYGDEDYEWTTTYPFLPITDKNNTTDQTNSPYYQDPGVANAATFGEHYNERNYNYVLVSEGDFVYYADDQLFFDFEGDDDVYLFVNGELVLDIGGAHSITKEKINLNDYVEAARTAATNGSTDPRDIALALEDGETYSFNFYYMERHGTGANMRIATNIRVTDPAMETQKTAYQDGNQLAYGDSIDKDKIVEYGFAMKNVGNNRLYNLSFRDDDIGVTIDYANGLTIKDGYNGVRVFDANGGTLEASDLYAIAKGTAEDGTYVERKVDFESNAELIAFLKDMTDSNVVESGGGLWQGSTVEIRGFAYKLTEEQSAKGVFDNIVYSSAWDSKSVGEGEYLMGQATMRVFVLAEPMYYQWANHEITISQTEFIEDILAASETANNVLAGKVNNLATTNVNKIEECTQKGLSTDYSQVTIDSSYNITVNYPSTGSRVFYVKVTYNNSSASVVVPVLVNVTDVKDSVYVLDYGLKVDLTEDNEFFKNDTVTVPARGTNAAVLAIGNTTPSYGSNKINFTSYEGTDPLGEYGDYNLEITEKHLETVTELETNTPYAILSCKLKMALMDEDGLTTRTNTSLTGIKLKLDATVDEVVPWYYNGTNLIMKSPTNSEGYLNLTQTTASIGSYDETNTVNNVYLNSSSSSRSDTFTIENSNLSARLNQYGGTVNDLVATHYYATGVQNEGSAWYFKEIVPLSGKLTYTPGGTTSKFMEGLDTIWTAVSVQDSEYMTSPVLGTVDINHEVQMYKQVTVLPATVVYYEDDYPAITYYKASRDEDNNLVETVTNEFTTGSSSDLSQSADQEQEYGQDEAYQTGSTAQSGGSLTTIALTDVWKMASFQFTGTGFELISRTNAADSGVIAVQVYKGTEITNANKVYSYPVITEFDNGADGGNEGIYQVPVIRVENLEHGTYTVVIRGLKNYGGATTYFYMDGLRIFQPLGATNKNYTAEENGAAFTELRDLIIAGDAAVADITSGTLTLSSGLMTWTENRNGELYDGSEYKGNTVSSVNDYLTLGPNNEVYMDGSTQKQAIVFYVKEDAEKSVHNLQLAVRGIDSGLFYGSGSTGVKAVIEYGTQSGDTYAWEHLATVTSSTEQYYTIDYTKCPHNENLGYQVAIQVTYENLDQDTTTDGTQITPAFASYTSIKTNGLNVNTAVTGDGFDNGTTLKYVNGILTDTAATQPVDEGGFFSLRSIRLQMMAEDISYDEDLDDGSEPEVDVPSDDDQGTDTPEGGDTSSDDEQETDKPSDSDTPSDDGQESDKPSGDDTSSDVPSDDDTEADVPSDDKAETPEKDPVTDSATDSNKDEVATGDNANSIFWVVLLGAAFVAIVAIVVKRRRA